MVLLLGNSKRLLNGSDAKQHASGVPVTGARVLRSGHHNAANSPRKRTCPGFFVLSNYGLRISGSPSL